MIFARKARSFIRKKAEQLLSFVKFNHTFDIVAIYDNYFLQFSHGGKLLFASRLDKDTEKWYSINLNHRIMLIFKLAPSVVDVLPEFRYDDIKSEMTEEVIDKFLSAAPSVDHPFLIHMLGIPGAGKSTYYAAHKEELPPHVFVGFDTVMEALPSYQEDLKKSGSVEAFKKWELPARVIGYELLERAIAAKKNIFFDHGGSPQAHAELLSNIKTLGYKTRMIYVTCDVNVALERAVEREKITHRHTPPQMIIDRAKLVSRLAPQYEEIVDEFIKV